MKQHIFSHLKIGGYLLWQLGNLSLGRNFGMREGVTFIEIGESFEQTPEILDDPKSWFCSISTPQNIKKTRPSQYSVRKDWSLLSTIKSGESKALIASTRCHWQVQGRFFSNHFRLEIPETRNHICVLLVAGLCSISSPRTVEAPDFIAPRISLVCFKWCEDMVATVVTCGGLCPGLNAAWGSDRILWEKQLQFIMLQKVQGHCLNKCINKCMLHAYMHCIHAYMPPSHSLPPSSSPYIHLGCT